MLSTQELERIDEIADRAPPFTPEQKLVFRRVFAAVPDCPGGEHGCEVCRPDASGAA